jgi:hypothetical protein
MKAAAKTARNHLATLRRRELVFIGFLCGDKGVPASPQGAAL